MKKELLLASALLTVISAFPQNKNATQQTVTKDNSAAEYEARFNLMYNPIEKNLDPSKISQPTGPVQPLQRSGAVSSWTPISGSMNIYGMLVSNSKPLQYHQALNAVSFIHRKSLSYVPLPAPSQSNAATGVIVAQIASNIDALSWDSTCIWNNNTNWARYPQGAIYNPPGNTSLSNAYVVASGPITQANNTLGWVGSYLTSKKLNVFDNVASTVPNAQQFIPNATSVGNPSYTAVGKIDFPRYDMTVTGDTIRALGGIFNTKDNTGQPNGFRGANIIKGYLDQVTGTMVWKSDTVTPDAELNNSGGLIVQGQPHMAWNNSGSVGYVWFIGCRLGNTGNNKGHQPIVYKTTTYGRSWTEVTGPDFNSTSYSLVTSKLDSVPGTNNRVPQFNFREGFDGIVDINNKLHIVSTIIGTSSSHVDSLLATFSYPNADGENYHFPHEAGRRPYIYDFTEGATNGAWNVTIIDSMSTEAPGTTTGTAGFSENPWDATGGTSNTDKVSSDARIQLSRSADGKYIIYTWAESDISFTSGLRWNSIPNVKARAAIINSVSTGTNVGSNLLISSNKINVTQPSVGFNPFVASRAQMHYVSPLAKVVSTIGLVSADFKLPMTVTNNQNTPMTQLLPNTHWYATTELSFIFNTDGINEQVINSVNNSILFPNPAKDNASVLINLKANTTVDLKIMNLIGGVVKTTSYSAVNGENELSLNLEGLSSGIYLVNIKVGGASSTKKLIIE